VAINDLGSAEMNAHLLEFDTVHGRFPGKISASNGHLKADGHDIAVLPRLIPRSFPGAISASISSWNAPADSPTATARPST
jgi:glyceraldehyde-3-phosphate dehydrogenase/erythrose-4-phosphate dehydrogenase